MNSNRSELRAVQAWSKCDWAQYPRLILPLLLIGGVLAPVALLPAQKAAPIAHQVPSVSFASPVNYSIGGRPQSIAAADFNKDGHMDLAVLRDQPAAVDILLGQADGAFRLFHTVSMDYWNGCHQLVTADLNHDGNLDLAITQGIPGAVRVFLGDGSGCFQPAESDTLAKDPYALEVSDFNGDGMPDLAFIDGDEGAQLRILTGERNGTLRPRTAQPVGSGLGTVVTGDVDGDGILDLVLPNGRQDHLNILIGQGDGTFLSEARVSARNSPLGTVCGDFNGDGKLDLATANWDGDSVGVFLGRGDGTFQGPIEYAAGNLPIIVAAADLNADGHLDLVVAHHQGAELDLLLGTGEGIFVGPAKLRAGAGVHSLTIADLNGDGRPDLATVNVFDKSVSVLLNNTERTPEGLVSSERLASAARHDHDGARPAVSGPRTLEKSLSEYRVDAWTTDRGLPQNTVQCLLQTQDGYLWVGTQNGLARYDGLRFTVFDRNNTPAFRSDNILCLAEGPDRTLWIGTSDGLVQRQNRAFVHVSPGMLSSGDAHVWGLHPSRSGNVWLASGGGLVRLGVESAALLPREVGVRSVLEDDCGRLWVGGDSGLRQRPAGSTNWEEVFQTEEVTVAHGASAVCQDRRGDVWFGNVSGLWRWRDGQFKLYGVKQGLSPGVVSSIAPDNENRLWVAVGGQVNRFHADQIVRLGSVEEATGAFVRCVYPDREGNVWLGTARSGLVRLSPRRLVTYTTRDGLIHDDVWSICEGKTGELWMGTRVGVSRFSGEKFRNHPSVSDAFFSSPIFQDRSGTVWLQSDHSLATLRDGKPETYAPEAWPLFEGVSSIYQDRSGVIWVAASHGLWRLNRNQSDFYAVTAFTNWPPVWSAPAGQRSYTFHSNALPNSSLLGVLEDHAGHLWVGSKASGLHCLREGRFTTLTTSNGLTSDFVGPLLADRDGTLWVGSDKGLNRLKDGRVTRYSTAQGLAENLVANLLEDDAGWFWTMGHRGIHRMRKQDLNDLADGKRPSFQTISYGEADGMLSSEGNVGIFPNTCQSADGLLWFPTVRGVVAIEPHELEIRELPPPAIIEQVLADDKMILGDGKAEGLNRRLSSGVSSRDLAAERPGTPLRLAPGCARLLEFDYTAGTFVAPEKVRFRYKLEGHDTDWRDAGARRAAFYTDLAPGSYRFLVRAINHHGLESQLAAEFPFSLAAHFYQTKWFRAGSGLGLLLTGLGLHRFRIRTLGRHQALKQELALARQRERIAKDMHDDLGASLTQIGLLSEHARRDPNKSTGVAVAVEKIADAARQTAQAVDEIVWTVNPRHDTVDSLAIYLAQFAREYLEPCSLRCRLDMPEVLPARRVSSEVRHNLVLFVKEALHNAVKHSAAQQVSVALRLDGDLLAITVTDDGRGLHAQVPGLGPTPVCHGNGFGNMRHRIESVGGQFELSDSAGGGVSVKATVQLQP